MSKELCEHCQQCVEYVERELHKTPPKSACYFCPYHTDKEWNQLKENEPEAFAAAVEFDRKIRRRSKLDADLFIHRSARPLEEVNLELHKDDPNQLTFADECEGMCGV